MTAVFEHKGKRYRADCSLMTQANLEDGLFTHFGRGMSFSEVINRVTAGLPAYGVILVHYCTRVVESTGERGLELHEVGPLAQDADFLLAFLAAFTSAAKAAGNELGLMAPSIQPSSNGAAPDTIPASSSHSPDGQLKPRLKARK
jgi:hypothetical protein